VQKPESHYSFAQPDMFNGQEAIDLLLIFQIHKEESLEKVVTNRCLICCLGEHIMSKKDPVGDFLKELGLASKEDVSKNRGEGAREKRRKATIRKFLWSSGCGSVPVFCVGL